MVKTGLDDFSDYQNVAESVAPRYDLISTSLYIMKWMILQSHNDKT